MNESRKYWGGRARRQHALPARIVPLFSNRFLVLPEGTSAPHADPVSDPPLHTRPPFRRRPGSAEHGNAKPFFRSVCHQIIPQFSFPRPHPAVAPDCLPPTPPAPSSDSLAQREFLRAS